MLVRKIEINRLNSIRQIFIDCGDIAKVKMINREIEDAWFDETLLDDCDIQENFDDDDCDCDDDYQSPDWRIASESEIIRLIKAEFDSKPVETGASRRTYNGAGADGNGNIPDNRGVDSSLKHEDLGFSRCPTAIYNDRCRDIRFEKRDIHGIREYRRVFSPSKHALVLFDRDKPNSEGGYQITPSLALAVGSESRNGFLNLGLPKLGKDCSLEQRIDRQVQNADLAKLPVLSAIHSRMGSDTFKKAPQTCFWTGVDCYFPPSNGGIFLNKKASIAGYKDATRESGLDLSDPDKYLDELEKVPQTKITAFMQANVTDWQQLVCLEMLELIDEMHNA